jgi:ATP-dependent exoDNAse (exonuclease V) beta subunit
MSDFSLSASRVKSLTECKRKFYHQYIIKDLPFEGNAFTDLGTAIHDVLENWRHDPSLSKADLIGDFTQRFKPTSNFSWLVNDGYKIISNVSPKKVFLGKLVGTEVGFEETYDDDLFVRGFIDKVEEVNGEIVITDYKTNRKIEPNLYHHQIAVYDLAASRLYPDMPKRYELYYVRHDKVVPIRIRKDFHKETEKSLHNVRQYVEDNKENPLVWDKLKKRSYICKYCPLADKCW